MKMYRLDRCVVLISFGLFLCCVGFCLYCFHPSVHPSHSLDCSILLNLQPGRGNFVVRVDGVDQPIVELLGMKRPFPPLKALDMDDVNEKILSALEE